MAEATRGRGQDVSWTHFRQGLRKHMQPFIPDLAPAAKES